MRSARIDQVRSKYCKLRTLKVIASSSRLRAKTVIDAIEVLQAKSVRNIFNVSTISSRRAFEQRSPNTNKRSARTEVRIRTVAKVTQTNVQGIPICVQTKSKGFSIQRNPKRHSDNPNTSVEHIQKQTPNKTP